MIIKYPDDILFLMLINVWLLVCSRVLVFMQFLIFATALLTEASYSVTHGS